MEWSDIGKTLLGIAPTLATALGGPVGIVAGGAITVLKQFLNLPSDAPAEVVSAELAKLTPADYVRLREADTQFKKDILAAGVNLEQIAAQDRDSARKMYVAQSAWPTNILAGLIVVGWFGLNYVIFKADAKFANMDLILRTLGTIDMAVGGVIYFFFGSSKGSDALKNIMANMKGVVQ